MWMEEGRDHGYVLIYVGEDQGTHTVRWETLRVSQNGVVEKLNRDPLGNEVWIPDR